MTAPGRQQSRSRACNACREAKTKCVITDGQSKCSHCLKYGKLCVVPTARKPRIKAAERFAALEVQVQTLNAALESRKLGSKTGPSGSEHLMRITNEATRDNSHTSIDGMATGTRLEVSTMKLLINHWNISMQPYFPFVGTIDVDKAFNDTDPMPVLLMLVACIGSLAMLPAVSAKLIEKTNEELVRRVYLYGEQSTDLALALLLHSQFLAYHNQSDDLRFSPHAYTASAMALDLGLDKLALTQKPLDGHEAAKSARMWLAGYCAMSISASLLHRKRFAEDDTNLELIMTNMIQGRHRIPSDQSLCELVELHQIVSESSKMTSRNHQPACDDPTTSFQLAQLNQLLENWIYQNSHGASPARTDQATTLLLYNAVKLYINRLALIEFRLRFISLFTHQQHNKNLSSDEASDVDHISVLRSLTTELSENHLDMLQLCSESSQRVVHLFVSLPVSTARSLPLSYYHWILFAIVCLLKLAPLSEILQRPISIIEDPDVDRDSAVDAPDACLQLCSDRLRDICQNGHSPQLTIFFNVLDRLRTYYLQKKELCMSDQVGECDDGVSNPGGRALNTSSDDLNVGNSFRSEDIGTRLPEAEKGIEQDRAQEDFEGNADADTAAGANEEFLEQMDRFFEQEDDRQWLGLLDWEWDLT